MMPTSRAKTRQLLSTPVRAGDIVEVAQALDCEAKLQWLRGRVSKVTSRWLHVSHGFPGYTTVYRRSDYHRGILRRAPGPCWPKGGFITGEQYCGYHGRNAGWPCRDMDTKKKTARFSEIE